MTKPTTLVLTAFAAAALCVGYGIVRACTSGAIRSANDRCIEPPECSQTTYYTDLDLDREADGAVCETCSTYYQGCDSAGTNALGTNGLWTQYYVVSYDPTNHSCGLLRVATGCPQAQGPASTTYQTLDSGCGELTGPTAGRPIQWPIVIKPPRQPSSPVRQP
jgi:hypothetical protein